MFGPLAHTLAVRSHLWWAIGLGLVGLGIVLQATAPQDFGWFAYAGGDLHLDGVVLLTHQDMWGLSITFLGLLVLAGWLGFVLGRRTSRRAQGSET